MITTYKEKAKITRGSGGVATLHGGYWYAICPHCNRKIRGSGGYGYGWKTKAQCSESTRKNTKDALYRHLKQRDFQGKCSRFIGY